MFVVALKLSFNYTVVAVLWHISTFRKNIFFILFFLVKKQNNNKQSYNNIIV